MPIKRKHVLVKTKYVQYRFKKYRAFWLISYHIWVADYIAERDHAYPYKRTCKVG